MQSSLVEGINYSFSVVGYSDFNRSETPYALLKDEDVTEKFLELLTSLSSAASSHLFPPTPTQMESEICSRPAPINYFPFGGFYFLRDFRPQVTPTPSTYMENFPHHT